MHVNVGETTLAFCDGATVHAFACMLHTHLCVCLRACLYVCAMFWNVVILFVSDFVRLGLSLAENCGNAFLFSMGVCDHLTQP